MTKCRAVSRLGEPVVRNGDTPASNNRFDSIYGKDPYFRKKQPASILCMPISRLGGTAVIIPSDESLLSRKFSCSPSVSTKAA